jgi:hypothetical protein
MAAILVVVALLATAAYVGFTRAAGIQGFALDDAWIHQTYARNLAESGQLAYTPGAPSAGSTSPAWSFLLSVGYLLGIDVHVWTYLLGGLSLGATAWLLYRIYRRLPALGPAIPPLEKQRSRHMTALLAGLFCAVEWHMVWAAASGMETTLFTALSLALLEAFFALLAAANGGSDRGPASLRTEEQYVRAVGIGLLGGLLILTRPEGLGLVGLVLGGMLLLRRPGSEGGFRQQLLTTGMALAVTILVLVPYLNFNLTVSGTLWPNTLYAKQVEYRSSLGLPLRFWQVLAPTLVGAQILLLPGFLLAIYYLIRRRTWTAILPLAWWLGFLLVYALLLPVGYQHGRYTMPTIPILLLYGTWGTAAWLRPRSPHLLVRVSSQALPVAVALLALLFWGRGALAYRDDVALIQGEMVATARWLQDHTEPGDLLAVHDIGAVGYFSQRSLLDLAGLITPEVIPFMTDAPRLADWIVERGAEYAVFFPDFSSTYVQLAADPRFEEVYCTGYAWTRAQGRENMCVYHVSSQ